MKRKHLFSVLLCILGWLLFPAAGQAAEPVKISIFNFTAQNLEASSYGTTISNMLTGIFRSNPTLSVLDRKDLESFLILNDLQQNDEPENVFKIGTRLGLDVIVAGRIKTSGSMIVIDCKAFHMGRKRIFFSRQLATGDSGLGGEAKALSGALLAEIEKQSSVSHDAGRSGTAPAKLEAGPGNAMIFLRWEPSSGFKVGGYKIYRSKSGGGPFTMIAQVQKTEYSDQNLEMNTAYYYKVRAYSASGIQGLHSQVLKAETMPSPNPPIILKAEGLVKSVYLVWSPCPSPSDDPIPLKGYVLYRAKAEDGPYREVKKLEARDFGSGSAEIAQMERLEMIHAGLDDGERVYYKVTAYNEKGGESAMSLPVEAVTIPAVKRVAATGNMIREIHIEWDRVEGVKGYYLYRSRHEKADFQKIQKIDAPSSSEANAPVTAVDTESLADETRYFYKVTAFLEPEKETSLSAAASAITKGKPPVPKGLKAASGLAKRVELSWKANPEEEVEGYLIYRCDSKEPVEFTQIKKIEGRQNTAFVDVGNANLMFFRSNNLEDKKKYHYKLATYNRVDVRSELSPTVAAETKSRPQGPSGLEAKYDGMRVHLRWAPNKESDIVSYIVYERDGDRLKKIKSVKETSFSEREKPDGRTKYYAVSALDGDDLESDPSRETSVVLK